MALAGLVLCLAPSSTETAIANGDTRTLILFNNNTKESLVATFRQNGAYDSATLDKLNWFLRDWRRDEPTKMDPRLFDLVWEVYHAAGVIDQPIVVYSGYRSPETNGMLRRRSRQVAEHSQHMLGKAMDSTMPGVSMEQLREIGMRMQRGGVGYYQSANFVHLDVGSVRSWPRMPYDQLARLFPDGKTVHIPANGQPMARYEEARAEIEARGNGAYAPPSQSKGLFAWLFGGGGADEAGEEEEVVATTRRGRAAPPPPPAPAQPALVAAREAPPPPTVVAAAPPAPEDTAAAAGGAALASAPASGDEAPTLAADTSDIVVPLPPRRPLDVPTFVAAVPMPPARPAMSFVALGPATSGKPDAIGHLIAATATTAAPPRPAALPGVITQGTSARRAALPGAGSPILAYAAVETAPSAGSGLRPASETLVPARLDRSNFRSLTGAASTAATKTQSVLGPAVTGLRQAMHAVGNVFASEPSTSYVSRFEAHPAAPDTSRFSGSALPSASPASAADRIASTATR